MPEIADIKPGSRIAITVTKTPARVSASKTIARVLCKDETHKAEVNRQRKCRERHNRPTRRSGRIWVDRVIKQHAVKGVKGETGTVLATPDVIRDLGSVSKFVSVASARS